MELDCTRGGQATAPQLVLDVGARLPHMEFDCTGGGQATAPQPMLDVGARLPHMEIFGERRGYLTRLVL